MVNFLEELQTDILMVQKINYKDMIWYTSWTQLHRDQAQYKIWPYAIVISHKSHFIINIHHESSAPS